MPFLSIILGLTLMIVFTEKIDKHHLEISILSLIGIIFFFWGAVNLPPLKEGKLKKIWDLF